jgi:two-component system, cell cycle sensor histidine kinase PleC
MTENEMKKQIELLTTKLEKQQKVISNLTHSYRRILRYNRQKTDFFISMIHEMKMPVSVILSTIQLMESNSGIQNKLKDHSFIRYASIIKKNCYAFVRIINNFLDMAKIDSGHCRMDLKNYDIVRLIREVVESAATYAESRKIELSLTSSKDRIITAVDVYKIERVVLNLISNSIKFTSQGGFIRINIHSSDGIVYISVEDTGSGIPPLMHEMIFQRFNQIESPLNREFHGSGIGLSLVKAFTEMHGGKVKVSSEENKGSKFIVEIPIKYCDFEKDKNRADSQDISQSDREISDIANIELSDIYNIDSSA